MYKGTIQLMLTVFITLHVRAMENTIVPMYAVPSKSGICYFENLLDEICNKIAYLLLWETQQELVERTKIKKTVALTDYYHYFEKGFFGSSETEWLRALCPDESKCAVINVFAMDCAKPIISIADLCNKRVMYSGGIESKMYESLALSQSGNIIAMIYKRERDSRVIIAPRYGYTLALQELTRQRSREVGIPLLQERFTIDFNKQGTHIIVHGVDYTDKQNPCNAHVIFSLKNCAFDTSFVSEDTTHKLHNYFKCNGICKSIKGTQ